MGVLIKHKLVNQEALRFFRRLSISKQKEAVSIWQEQLPDSDTCKTWSFTLISLSSSKIELIYKFFNNIV